jgi:hypothetical protein
MTGLITVVESRPYLAAAERLMVEEERAAVVDILAAAPDAGVLMKGTGGLRKLRIALAGRGKRGGARVIYWFHSVGYPAVLLMMFAKNEADDLTAQQRKRLVAVGEAILGQLGAKR